MAKRISDEQRIEDYFLNASQPEAEAMVDKVRLIMRFRNFHTDYTPDLEKRKRRPRKRTGGAIDVKLKEPEAKP